MEYGDEIRISDQSEWVWIGFKFGIGFGLASSLFAFTGALIMGAFTSVQVDNANRTMSKALSDFNRSIPTPTAAPPQHHFRTVTVPPKAGQECLAETHGVLDEEYQRCNAGYSYQVQID